MDVPFGSIMAAILVCVGAGAFCGTCQVALLDTINMFDPDLTSDELYDRTQDL